MNPEERAQLEQIVHDFESLKAASTIPYEVEQAFRERLGIRTFSPFSVSSKGADTEDLSINEGGAATKIAMNDPAGFLQVTIANTVYYLPYFTS